MKASTLPWQLLLVFVLSLSGLVCVIWWLQNVHIVTTNGMYKSIGVEAWVVDPAHARLDPSNYLYFPVNGRLCAVLDWLGVAPGQAWKQLAFLNAFFASIGSVIVYAFVHHLTGSRLIAASTSVLHVGTGFVLLLSVINEDIMPGYVIVLGAMMLAALWFDRPDWRQIVTVGVVFTVGWLVEWRLIFPTLPAFLAALALSEGPLRRRAGRIALLLAAIVATAGIVQQVWEGHNGAVGLHDLLWTGKGVDSGWGGITLDKAWLLLSGMSSYFLMLDVAASAEAARNSKVLLSVPAFLELAILGASVRLHWPQRHDPRLRSIACVFLGTLAAGEVFNIYAQPHDPQMQINVMVWLTVAWALSISAVLARRRNLWPITALAWIPLAINLMYLSSYRGEDTRMTAALTALEERFSSQSTVFLYWGFETITTWQYALWSHTWDWESAGPPPPAPSMTPSFKWIAIDAGAIRHPHWSAEQDAQSIKQFIEAALESGYRVAVSSVWDWSVQQLGDQLGTLSAADRAPAIHSMLHQSFAAGSPTVIDGAGAYYELRRR